MPEVSLNGVCDMHVHTNPDLRLMAYNDFELAEVAIRVGARAIVIKSHQGFTANRAFLTNEYVRKIHGENTGFTMYGSVTMNKSIGGKDPSAGVDIVIGWKVVPELLEVFKMVKDYGAVLGIAHFRNGGLSKCRTRIKSEP